MLPSLAKTRRRDEATTSGLICQEPTQSEALKKIDTFSHRACMDCTTPARHVLLPPNFLQQPVHLRAAKLRVETSWKIVMDRFNALRVKNTSN